MREFLTGCLSLCLATFGFAQSPNERAEADFRKAAEIDPRVVPLRKNEEPGKP
jgi:hypothetical protein